MGSITIRIFGGCIFLLYQVKDSSLSRVTIMLKLMESRDFYLLIGYYPYLGSLPSIYFSVKIMNAGGRIYLVSRVLEIPFRQKQPHFVSFDGDEYMLVCS